MKPPEWKHAMVLACRKAGESGLHHGHQRFGVEVFLDPNTGNTVYISEAGSLAIVPAKDPA